MDIFTIRIDRKLVSDVPADTLSLNFFKRERSRQSCMLESGETIALQLSRGTRLWGGDLVSTAEGRNVQILAAKEPVTTVYCESGLQLARLAYHLGNRHVRVQVGEGWIRYSADHVLDAMVRQLGANPVSEYSSFEPEPGAYHAHEHGASHGHQDGTGNTVAHTHAHDLSAR